MSRPGRDDRILPETRWVVAPILIVLAAAFVLLYIWPDDTERLFAWTIRPRLTPLIMGAGYLGGAVTLARVLTRSRWHEVGMAFPAIVPFTVFMAGATALHWDRFNHGHVTFWLWVAIYATTPFLLTALWLRNRHADPRTSAPGDPAVPASARRIMAAGGTGSAVVAVFLFCWPTAAIAVWPWQLTPLTSRVIAGWFALSAGSALMMAQESRWSASRGAVLGGVVFAALQLAAIVRAWSDFDPANPLTWAYAALVAGSLVGLLWLYLSLEARRRRVPGALSEAARAAS
jgi:hypothetical protein